MKKIILLTALAALSACSKKTNEAVPAADTSATATVAADSPVGSYDVKMADGTMGKTVINADGTYVDTDAKGAEIKGKFAQKERKDCFDPDGDKPEECWTVEPPAADGSFKATAPDGKMTVTVTKTK
ncbi:MAG: hypothetical protein ACKOUT_15855 [Novosphingobium sp.]